MVNHGNKISQNLPIFQFDVHDDRLNWDSVIYRIASGFFNSFSIKYDNINTLQSIYNIYNNYYLIISDLV